MTVADLVVAADLRGRAMSVRQPRRWRGDAAFLTSLSHTSNLSLSLLGCLSFLNLWLSSNSGLAQLETVLVWNFSSSSFFSQSFTMTYGSEDQPGSSEEPSRCVHLRK